VAKVKILPLLLALLVAATLLAAGGCDSGAGKRAPDGLEPPGETRVVLLFFADAKAVNSGKQGEYGFVAPVAREVAAGEDPVEAALAELIRGPRPEEGHFFGTVPSTAQILELQVDGAVVYIDFSHELLSDSPGGTLSGTVFMQSMIFTMTQFPGIEKVAVLVEGDPWCDGHFIWEEPLGPEDLMIGAGEAN